MSRICAAKCMKEIKDDKIVKCSGVTCNKIYHESCIEYNLGIRGLSEKLRNYDNFSYRCNSCKENDMNIKKMMEIVLIELKAMNKNIDERLKMMNERIGSIESNAEISKTYVDAVKKNIENVKDDLKSAENKIISEVNSQLNDNEKWQKVVRKKNKNKNHAVVIKPTDVEKNRNEIKKSLCDSIDASQFDTSGIVNISDNGIIINCNSEQSQVDLIEKINKSMKDVTASKPKDVRPRLKILYMYDPDEDNVLIVSLSAPNKMCTLHLIHLFPFIHLRHFPFNIYHLENEIANKQQQKARVE
ncbi:hypothetical protein PVAND_009235 [Polypedilum vanderplanki]|uniref:PHD-type domain-containing protein n=1 Tax=Polypedilum vanderplanki TaxID=319348 RepID=A0A9J6CC96_POLVA|nr:hypothetical protein PVAND_009235 [Polypedilum vanderplanki]